MAGGIADCRLAVTLRTRYRGRRSNGVRAAAPKIALPSVAMSIPVEYVKVRSRPSRHGLYWTTAVLRTRWERVAQSVEHVTFNHGVEGSSPSALTSLFKQLSASQPSERDENVVARKIKWRDAQNQMAPARPVSNSLRSSLKGAPNATTVTRPRP